MAFHDVQLPADVERGATGGPRFNTTVLGLSSGYERRNANWELVRGQWDIGYGLDSKANLDAVKAHFYTCLGKLHSFRFKDWTDYEIGSSGSPQTIGTGDGVHAQFQIYKRYTSGAYMYSRAITRPVASGFQVYLDGVLKTITTHYTLNASTGVITFVSVPTMGQVVAVVGEFDVPVRFDIDDLSLKADGWDGSYSIPGITLVEVREQLATLS